MREIAVVLCRKFDLHIECRYLYTSRAALRTPTYHLIGDEAYDLLLGYSYQVTPRSMLQRALIPQDTQKQILDEIGIRGIVGMNCLRGWKRLNWLINCVATSDIEARLSGYRVKHTRLPLHIFGRKDCSMMLR